MCFANQSHSAHSGFGLALQETEIPYNWLEEDKGRQESF